MFTEKVQFGLLAAMMKAASAAWWKRKRTASFLVKSTSERR